MKLINNTKGVSKLGYLVKVDPKDPLSFVYATASDTSVLGVVGQEVAYKGSCEIITSGTAMVFVSGNVVRGSVIRSRKSTDNISNGQASVVRSDDYPYLQVGIAIENGRGLVKATLNFVYYQGPPPTTIDWDNVTDTPTTLSGYGVTDVTANTMTIGTGGNTVQIDADGEMSLTGTATVWDDIRIIPNVFDVPGGTDPNVIGYQPGGSGATFKVYAFAKGDEGFFTLQLPHGYKVGSDLKAHVHWTPGPRGVAENGNTVQWRLDYSFASIGSNFPASSTLALPGVCDGVNHKHRITAEATISGVGLGISAQMWGRIYRWNNASDTWAGTGNNLPIFIEFDIHYEIDTMGSKESTSK